MHCLPPHVAHAHALAYLRAARIYAGERFYDDMIDYGHPPGAYGQWMG
jgi:hypothetical protein